MHSTLSINISRCTFAIEDTFKRYRNLVEWGFASTIIANEVPPRCDRLVGPANRSIFANGVLAGIPVPNNGRLSADLRSFFTGGIKEVNQGGASAHKMARLGIKEAIIKEGVKDGTGRDSLGAVISSKNIKVTPRSLGL